MGRVRLTSCLLACSIPLIAACGSDALREPPVAKQASPVINGSLDTGTTHDTVVYIQFVIDATSGLGGACTGTLIAPNVVTTARHCVSNLDESVYPPRVLADFDPKNMAVFLHTQPTGVGPLHGPDAKVARIVHDTAATLENSDFALIVLDQNIGTDYAQVRLKSPPTRGESVFVVGYGITQDDTGSPSGAHARYWRDGLSVLGVGPDPYLGDREMYMGESICQGDSGGPVMDHGSGALLAVTSRGGNGTRPTSTQPWAGCVGSSAQNIFTRVDGYADMIRKTLADYGRIPWEEGAPKPPDPVGPPPPSGVLGSPCGVPLDCKTHLCVNDGTGSRCSQTCSASNPCPGGFDCAGGYCVPSLPPPPPDDAGTKPPPSDAGPGAVDSGAPDGDVPPQPDSAPTDSKGGCSAGGRSSSARDAWVLGAMLAMGLVARRRRHRHG